MKKKFQAIQEAYAVLSDESKWLLYDARVYDSEDDDVRTLSLKLKLNLHHI